MRGLNLKEIMFKSNMNQQGLNIATYRQAYALVSCSTSTPINHIVFFFFFGRIPVVLENRRSSQGRGAHPLHPPPRSAPVRPTNIYYQLQFHLTFVPVIHGVLTYCCILTQVFVVVFIVVVFVLILSTEMQPYIQ